MNYADYVSGWEAMQRKPIITVLMSHETVGGIDIVLMRGIKEDVTLFERRTATLVDALQELHVRWWPHYRIVVNLPPNIPR